MGCDDLDKVKEYASANELSYKIIVPKDKEFRKKNKISGVPQTIILNKNVITTVTIGYKE